MMKRTLRGTGSVAVVLAMMYLSTATRAANSPRKPPKKGAAARHRTANPQRAAQGAGKRSAANRPSPARPTAAGGTQRLTYLKVTQVFVDLPAIDIWVEARDENKRHVVGIERGKVVAKVEGKGLQIIEKVPSNQDRRGTAFVLLLDASETMARRLGRKRHRAIDKAREAAELIIRQLKGADRMAIVRFGSDVRTVVDFTGEKDQLRKGLQNIKAKDRYTQLWRGVLHGLKMLDGLDDRLPPRRVVIVLSDGKNEDPARKLTHVEQMARKVPVPIMAIWFSTFRRQDLRDRYYAKLEQVANYSHGHAFKIKDRNPASIVTEFRRMLRRLQEGYLIRTRWRDCESDGEAHAVVVEVSLGGTTRVGERRARMIASRPNACKPDPQAMAPSGTQKDRGATTAAAKPWHRKWTVWLGAGLVLLTFMVGVVLFARRRREHSDRGELDGDRDPSFDSADPIGTDSGSRDDDEGIEGTKGASATVEPTVEVALEVINGAGRLQPAQDFYQVGPGGLVIGREGALMVAEDSEISSQHCKIFVKSGAILIEDLGSTNGTRRNGVPLVGIERLEDRDELELGQTQLRFLKKEA